MGLFTVMRRESLRLRLRRGSTIIDYIIGDSEVRDKIVRMTVGDRVDSDHHPVEVRLEGKVKGIWKGCKRRKCWRGAWDEESRKEFRRKMGRLEIGGRELDEELEIMEETVTRAIKEIKRERGKGKKRRGEWDEECEAKKGEMRRELRIWRRKGGLCERYRKGKQARI